MEGLTIHVNNLFMPGRENNPGRGEKSRRAPSTWGEHSLHVCHT